MTDKDAMRWCRGVFYLAMCAFTIGMMALTLPYLWGDGLFTTESVGYKIFGWLLASGVVVGGASALFLLTSDRN